jgi:hypothetical protein
MDREIYGERGKQPNLEVKCFQSKIKSSSPVIRSLGWSVVPYHKIAYLHQIFIHASLKIG